MYKLLVSQIEALADTDSSYIPLLSNVSALLNEVLDDINWVGFYIMRDNKLVLGPFQGKVACVHIEIGKGVCGTCVKEDRVQRIEDVHQFKGHIACDTASNSEMVLPIHKDNKIVAVLDIDSPGFNRFSMDDEVGLKKVVKILEKRLVW